jgi:hypothetical protein
VNLTLKTLKRFFVVVFLFASHSAIAGDAGNLVSTNAFTPTWISSGAGIFYMYVGGQASGVAGCPNIDYGFFRKSENEDFNIHASMVMLAKSTGKKLFLSGYCQTAPSTNYFRVTYMIMVD